MENEWKWDYLSKPRLIPLSILFPPCSYQWSFFIVLCTVQAQSKAPPNNQIMPFQRPICTVILSCRVQTGPTLNKHSKQILLSAQHRREPLHRIQTAIKGGCVSRYCTVLFPHAASILRSCLHVQRQAELQSCLALGSLTTWEKVILSQGTHVFSMSTYVPVTSYQIDSPLLLWEDPHWCSMFYPLCHQACLNQISSNHFKVQKN